MLEYKAGGRIEAGIDMGKPGKFQTVVYLNISGFVVSMPSVKALSGDDGADYINQQFIEKYGDVGKLCTWDKDKYAFKFDRYLIEKYIY